MLEQNINGLIQNLEALTFAEINNLVLGLNKDFENDNNQFVNHFYNELKLESPTIIKANNPEDFYLKLNQIKQKEKSIEILTHKFWVEFNANQNKVKPEDDLKFTELAKAANNFFLSSFYSITNMVQRILKKTNPNYSLTHPSLNINYHAILWLKKFHANHSNQPLNNLQKLFSKTNIFWCQTFQNTFLYCPLPNAFHFDENNLLHSETEAALQWENFEIYSWRGIEIPKRWILNPETISKQEIVAQKNAELRRIMQEVVGSERFAHLLGLQKLDEDYDLQGNLQTLYKTKEIDSIAKDYLYFARVSCPSTGRIYFLGVPPGLNNIWDAVAWTFGKTKETYKPLIET